MSLSRASSSFEYVDIRDRTRGCNPLVLYPTANRAIDFAEFAADDTILLLK
jgi:hypothetical protein